MELYKHNFKGYTFDAHYAGKSSIRGVVFISASGMLISIIRTSFGTVSKQFGGISKKVV